jgi:Zn-dependent protease with chaperone function
VTLSYANEQPLARIAFVFSALFWIGMVVGTMGIGAIVLGAMFIAYLFAQSGFISYVRGNGVRVSAQQLPEIHQRYAECCQRLSVATPPEIYVLNANGVLNALATRFLRRNYVILFSDVLDALAQHPDSIDFYLGHELGHIQRGHLRWAGFLAPAAMLPLLGAAYSRAREYTCDLYGLACCDVPKDAAYGLAVLATGERSLDQVDLNGFARQSDDTGGFWMSFHELSSDYPWLTKRLRRVMAAAGSGPVRFPSRHKLAWLLAMMTPRVGVGAGGGIAGAMIAVAFIGILAAIAIPNFLAFQTKAKLAQARGIREQVIGSASAFIAEHQAMPPSLEAMGLANDLSNPAVKGVVIEGQTFVMKLAGAAAEGKQIVLTPYIEAGELKWDCSSDVDQKFLQAACGSGAAAALAAAQPEAAPETSEAPAASAEPAAAGESAVPAPSASGTVNEATCSEGFQASEAYQALGAAGQEQLREACNAWRLQQLDAQAAGSGL